MKGSKNSVLQVTNTLLSLLITGTADEPNVDPRNVLACKQILLAHYALLYLGRAVKFLYCTTPRLTVESCRITSRSHLPE
jgi:hypothetical protein